MGKPAARLGDVTSHGGTLVLGAPTVLIGKMPAAGLGDMHVCPMVTGVVPHVGGPVALGSMGVLIAKKPAARVSDLSPCVGPPDMPAMGCMTVLIGEMGGAGGGGAAAAAAAAAAAKQNGPKTIKPFDPIEPAEPRTENHYVECAVVDGAGLPLIGLRYKLTDPDGNKIAGAVATGGRIRHDGYSQAGDFKVELACLANVKWSKAKCKPGENLQLKADAEGFEDGTDCAVMVFEALGNGNQRMLKSIAAKVQGKKVSADWSLTPEELAKVQIDSSKGQAGAGGKVEYFFIMVADGIVGVSDNMQCLDNAKLELLDADDKPLAEAKYEMHLRDGSVRSGKADKQGKAEEKDLPAGPYTIVLPEVVIKAGDGKGNKNPGSKGPKPVVKGRAKTDGVKAPIKSDKPDNSDSPSTSEAKEKPPEKIEMRFPLDAEIRKKLNKNYHNGAKSFGYRRKKSGGGVRLHAGCDLLCPAGTPIYAVADGIISRYENFYMATFYIEIDHNSFTARYGEVQPDFRAIPKNWTFTPPKDVCKGLAPGLSVGKAVKKGDQIGWVGELRELRDEKQVVVNTMLHLELYKGRKGLNLTVPGSKGYKYVPEGTYERRTDLLNPTKYLDEASDD